jgi:hypothetical protein
MLLLAGGAWLRWVICWLYGLVPVFLVLLALGHPCWASLGRVAAVGELTTRIKGSCVVACTQVSLLSTAQLPILCIHLEILYGKVDLALVDGQLWQQRAVLLLLASLGWTGRRRSSSGCCTKPIGCLTVRAP